MIGVFSYLIRVLWTYHGIMRTHTTCPTICHTSLLWSLRPVGTSKRGRLADLQFFPVMGCILQEVAHTLLRAPGEYSHGKRVPHHVSNTSWTLVPCHVFLVSTDSKKYRAQCGVCIKVADCVIKFEFYKFDWIDYHHALNNVTVATDEETPLELQQRATKVGRQHDDGIS